MVLEGPQPAAQQELDSSAYLPGCLTWGTGCLTWGCQKLASCARDNTLQDYLTMTDLFANEAHDLSKTGAPNPVIVDAKA